MARYRGSKAKICRRFGENIYGSEKYDRILARKNYAPGVHGKSFSRNKSEFGRQLLMKQKAKYIYGILEKQFRKHYEDVKNRPGVTGELLLARLEQRLDNVVYRLGFANTRPQARQIVNHAMICVNGKKVSIPSYEVKVGDEITINPTKKDNGYFKNQEQYITNKKNVSRWLSLDAKKAVGKVVALPKKDDFDANINVQVIVEFYSK
ncbi:MAG: 30S ribosomal protein S4 [Parcubacteria group bacterium]|jgi:small subunit ribosomal protein S4